MHILQEKKGWKHESYVVVSFVLWCVDDLLVCFILARTTFGAEQSRKFAAQDFSEWAF